MSETSVIARHSWADKAIHVEDLINAFKLSESDFYKRAQQLEHYGIASIDEIEDYNYRAHPVFIIHPIEDWPFWGDLALYCEKLNINLSTFTHDMQFGKLDSSNPEI